MAADPSNEAKNPGDGPASAPGLIVTALVNQALDDLEVERLEVADALRLVAEHAWSAGYHARPAAAGGVNGHRSFPRDAVPGHSVRLGA